MHRVRMTDGMPILPRTWSVELTPKEDWCQSSSDQHIDKEVQAHQKDKRFHLMIHLNCFLRVHPVQWQALRGGSRARLVGKPASRNWDTGFSRKLLTAIIHGWFQGKMGKSEGRCKGWPVRGGVWVHSGLDCYLCSA